MTQLTDNNLSLLNVAIKNIMDLLAARSVPLEPPEELVDVDGYPQLYSTLLEIRTAIMGFSSGNLDCHITKKGYLPGSIKALQASLRHLAWQTKMVASGDFTQRVDFMGDFSESFNSSIILLEESVRNLEFMAHTDPLTGSYNRGYFMECFDVELNRSKRHGHIFSVVMLDLDHFKVVNDTYGHAAGDEALRSLIRVLNISGLRTTDFFGRIGGEEFAIVLPETKIQEAVKAVERIRRNLEKTVVLHDGKEFLVTASMGISVYRDGDSQESLLERADLAMFKAKKTGRNKICVESNQLETN